ncbi:MAG: transposase [Verrucomicrobiia bacterium]|jgi:REP element-mobilizing transposase RayT
MARAIRVEFEGAVYHVMARGNERRRIFRADADRKLWLRTLEEMTGQFGVVVHVYCLMPNHYHMAVETPHANLSQALGWLQTTYTMRFNRRYRRSGHLFQGRFKAQLVEASGYGRELLRYIHLNPVRPRDKSAVIPVERVEELDAYPWSSHRAYAGLEPKRSWLSLEWLAYLGPNEAEARDEYRRSMMEAFGSAIASPWDRLQGGIVLGSEALWEKTKAIIGGKAASSELRWTVREGRRELQQRLNGLLETEPDDRVKIWARVRLGGERRVAVARAFGYSDGSGVVQVVKRLEATAAANQDLGNRLSALRSAVSSVMERPR